ncbi:MAG: hypothetical protein KDA65_17170 [Planctomycetaceae bacterium]|nr:hypothetical protein [Planctomycetaceae bacterium]
MNQMFARNKLNLIRTGIHPLVMMLVWCCCASAVWGQSTAIRYTPPVLSAASISTQSTELPVAKPAQTNSVLHYTPPQLSARVQTAAPAPLHPDANPFGHSPFSGMQSNPTTRTSGQIQNQLGPVAPNPRAVQPVTEPAAELPRYGLIEPVAVQAPPKPVQPAPKKEEPEYSTKLSEGSFTEYSSHLSLHDEQARPTLYDSRAFIEDPDYSHVPFLPEVDRSPYAGKYLNPTQKPWLEFGRGLYRYGPIPESSTLLGETNLLSPSFLLYGDYRAGMGYINNGTDKGVIANRLNLDFDLKLTDTERFHAFWGPLDKNVSFSRIEFVSGEFDYIDELDDDFDTFYFEGDVGSIYGGMIGEDAPFDMPVAIGFLPLLYQNGIWMEDAFLGAAVTVPAKNSRVLDWVNFDVTFFAGFNDISSPAFVGNGDGQTHLYGATAMIDAYEGYIETGYAYLDDRTTSGRSYHNIALGYSRRIQDFVSTAVRVIVNTGQDSANGIPTADGQLLLWENAFITSQPLTFVPYANFFLGFDRTQSVARAAAAGGILRNTGINFETDGLTGYPTLDATGTNTYGGAVGINWLGKDLDYQLVLELATVQVMKDRQDRNAPGDQYALGVRYQVPLNHAWIFRADAMHGVRDNADDVSGVRAELRWKF